jgi:hypothetical protein
MNFVTTLFLHGLVSGLKAVSRQLHDIKEAAHCTANPFLKGVGGRDSSAKFDINPSRDCSAGSIPARENKMKQL